MSERLRHGLQQRNKREKKVTDPGRGRTKQRGKNSHWLAATGREQQAHRQPQGARRTDSQEAEATPEGEGSKPKRQSADRGQSRLGEPGSRPTARGAQRREGHPERGHKQQQGAKLSNRPRHQPQPAEKRVGYERPPQTPNKGPWRTLERVQGNPTVRTHWGPPGHTPWVTWCADTRRQRRDVQPGTDQRTWPKWRY